MLGEMGKSARPRPPPLPTDPSRLPAEEAARPVGQTPSGQPPSVRSFIDDNKNQVDRDETALPSDDCRNYAYEGGGSSAGSLSSLNSGELAGRGVSSGELVGRRGELR